METSPGTQESQLISELARIAEVRARNEFLRNNPRLHNREAVDMLYDEVVRLSRIDVRQADRVAHGIAWIAGKIENEHCLALSLRAAGHVRLIRGKYAEALRSYRAALSLFRREGRQIEVGRTLCGGSLQALIYLGRYDEAFAWAQEAREIFARLGDQLRLARLDSNTGNILYRQDRFEEALRYYRRAAEQFERQGEPQDTAITLRNMAVCYISLADFETALDTYRAARSLCEHCGLHLLVAEADYNIAYLHYQRGEYTRAVSLYQSTRKHCETLGDPYHRALCDLDQSEMYLELNLDQEGEQLAEQAATAFRDLGMRYEEAKACAFLAISAGRQSKTTVSLQLFGRARRLFARERNQPWVALTDLYEAAVLFQRGRLSAARKLCERALAVFSGSRLQSRSAACELLLARIGLAESNPQSAQRMCVAALRRLDRNEFPILRCKAYLVLGQLREVQQRPRAAVRSYRKAYLLLEDVRSLLKGNELKIGFLKDKLEVYESLVWMYTSGRRTLQKDAAAFDCIERAKSRTLADLIAFRGVDTAIQGGSQGLLDGLRKELNWCHRQIEMQETGAEGQPSRIESLRRQARRCEDRLVSALADLQHESESFGVLHNAGTIGLETIRSILPRDRVILEYYIARGIVYACVIGVDTFELLPIARAAVIRDTLRLLQFQLSKFKLGHGYMRHFAEAVAGATQAHLQELQQQLVAPVWRWLRGKRLVVVPHDFMHCLPFHALHDGKRFLAEEAELSYAPSASIYYLCCTRTPSHASRSLVLGVPDSRAPHIVEEVQDVASLLPNAVLLVGKEASEANLRLHGPDSRFVHVATHGLFRQDNPMFSSMRLGDSQLSLIDLYSLRLSSELVTLSGCSTGLNSIVGGDELLGMVRGLLFAGSRAAVVSLWDVDDRSTAAFMRAFYGHLAKLEDIAAAMQTAMHDIRKMYPHPYYWAPFMAIGKTGVA